MKWYMLILTCAVMLEAIDIPVLKQVETQISASNNNSDLVAVYRSYKGDNNKRLIALQYIDSIIHSNKAFYVNQALQDEISTDIISGEPHLTYQAITTSGHLGIKGLKKTIIGSFMNADKTGGGYNCGIRQASMAAIEQIRDTNLAQVYLQLVIDRKDFWFDGDLLMALQGLAHYADTSCIATVASLKNRFQSFLNDPENKLPDYKERVYKLLEVTQNILKKVGK